MIEQYQQESLPAADLQDKLLQQMQHLGAMALYAEPRAASAILEALEPQMNILLDAPTREQQPTTPQQAESQAQVQAGLRQIPLRLLGYCMLGPTLERLEKITQPSQTAAQGLYGNKTRPLTSTYTDPPEYIGQHNWSYFGDTARLADLLSLHIMGITGETIQPTKYECKSIAPRGATFSPGEMSALSEAFSTRTGHMRRRINLLLGMLSQDWVQYTELRDPFNSSDIPRTFARWVDRRNVTDNLARSFMKASMSAAGTAPHVLAVLHDQLRRADCPEELLWWPLSYTNAARVAYVAQLPYLGMYKIVNGRDGIACTDLFNIDQSGDGTWQISIRKSQHERIFQQRRVYGCQGAHEETPLSESIASNLLSVQSTIENRLPAPYELDINFARPSATQLLTLLGIALGETEGFSLTTVTQQQGSGRMRKLEDILPSREFTRMHHHDL